MGNLRPIGSEKLQGMDKINRMIEISRYKENRPNPINEDKSVEYTKTLANGKTYRIDREKNGYVIKKTISESINLPLETMLKVANSKLNEEISTLSESEKNEIKEIVSLSKDELALRMVRLKESIVDSLKMKLNESSENDLKNTIEKTVDKIQNSPVDFYNYYKLRQLQEGL